MHFDENLFYDFQINEKLKKAKPSYEAKSQEVGWFLSNGDGESYDDVQSTYILKHRADYFYAQCEYGEALNCYKELLQSIPRTNTMLCHEINESVTLCLQKMNENLEAMNVIEKMLEANTMDVSLWLLLYKIHKDNNPLGAIFALQHCIELHEDIADYWLNLARSYTRLSNCFEFKDQNECHLSENMCTIQTHLPNDVGESASNADDTIERLNEMTLDNKTAKAALPKIQDMMLHPSCEKNDSLNQETVNTTVKTYAENHPYCFRTLCSAITGRFLQHKYSFHLSALQCQKGYGNFQEVGEMIKKVTCSSDIIIKTTEKLLKEKFASCSVVKTKLNLSPVADKNMVFATDEMTQRIQAFEKHWFPLL